MGYRTTVNRSICWFQRSGIMRPGDGFWGVAERLLLVAGNESMALVDRHFPIQTPLQPGLVVLEHRRADCNFEVAYCFDLAAEVLRRPALQRVADNVLDYLLRRSGLRVTQADSPVCGLWGWSNPTNMGTYWTDDNAWVAILALALSARGRPELREVGIAAARQLRRHVAQYLEHVQAHGRDAEPSGGLMAGLRLNPHWSGLATMALAWGASVDPEVDYAAPAQTYYRLVMAGPPPSDTSSRGLSTGLPWTLSEYGYLALAGSVACTVFADAQMRAVATAAADILVQHQQAGGHFVAEHFEAPAGTHLADLVYTQNWSTLGLYHAWLALGRQARHRQAFEQSLAFLARVQDATPDPALRGCWRGMYDTRTGAWGGGDRFEGGQNSIYSGWTNAPIAWAFLCDMSGSSLLPSSAGR